MHCFYHVCMNVCDSRVFKDSFVSIKLLFIYLMVHMLRIRMYAFQLSLYTNWPESRSISWDLWNGAFAGYKVCHWKVTKHFEGGVQYIPRNMHTDFALLCFVVVIHWLIFPYPSGLLHWHCGNLTIAPVPAKQPWWIWINTSCEFIMNDCVTTTKQSTTKPCAYFLGYTVYHDCWWNDFCVVGLSSVGV